MSDSIQIRPVYNLSEMDEVVKLQHSYWGQDQNSIVPAHTLFSLAANGGHVLVAFDGDTYAGVLMGFLGTSAKQGDGDAASHLHIYSKRMVVHADYRSRGLGFRLKMAQREFALGLGISLVAWTYDPLLAMNGNLNIRKLRAISRSFKENYYGIDNSGGLSPLGYSDRLYIEWHINSARVKSMADGDVTETDLMTYLRSDSVRLINPTTLGENGLPIPCDVWEPVDREQGKVLVEIPLNFYKIMDTDENLARRWREHSRQTLAALLSQGYVLTDFVKANYEEYDRAFYVLDGDFHLD